MNINKYITIALLALVTMAVVFESCNKRGLPHRKYRGQAPRGAHP
jgi:hypothetical protein